MHRWSELFIPTLREAPADAEVASHKFLVRAGYIRQLAAGIYSYLFLGTRSFNKIMAIVREELAQLAGVSAAYYTRLEQGQSVRASEEVLEALAAALRLTEDERLHLQHLARPGRPRRRSAAPRPESARPGTRQMLVVTRLPPGPVCHVAHIEVKGNPNANEEARKVADQLARGFNCDESPAAKRGASAD